MRIALLNKSTRVTNDEAQKMAVAVQMQLSLHWAPLWERLAPELFFAATDADVGDAFPLIIFDHSDQAGALGYHTEGPNGEVYGRVFVSEVLDAGGGVLDGGTIGESISSVVSHEATELAADEFVNVWVDGPPIAEGSCYALEDSDPVEAVSYDIILPDGTKVLVSAFVTPDWFDPEGEKNPKAVFAYPLGIVQKPFTMAQGGYMVVRREPGSEQQVFDAAKHSGGFEGRALDRHMRRRRATSHPASRTYRRGIRNVPDLVVPKSLDDDTDPQRKLP